MQSILVPMSTTPHANPLRSPEGSLPYLLFLVSFQFLLSGSNPTFYMDDSPETVAVCANWGVAHPPGYPLLATLGRLFALLPVGHVPFRVNLLVASLASATVAAIFLLLRGPLKVTVLPAALVSLAWVTGNSAFSSALSAKGAVYHLASLLLVLLLGAVLKRRLDAGGLILGLSLANHWMTTLAALPGILWLAWPTARNDRRSWRSWTPALLGLAAGTSLLLVLPLRASFHPAPNYGDPSSASRLLSHLLLEQFRGIQTLRLPEAPSQAVAWALAMLTEQPLLIPLGFLGLLLSWRRDRRFAIGLALLAGLPALLVNHGFPLTSRRFEFNYATQLFPTLLPWLALAALAGRDAVPGRRRLHTALLTAALLVGVLKAGPTQSRYTFVYDFGMNALQAVPRGGALFARGDAVDFCLWYLQWVDGKRPDAVVTTVENLPTAWYRARLRRDHPDIDVPEPQGAPPPNPFPGLVRPWASHLRTRGLHFTYNQLGTDGMGDAVLVPRGLLQEAFLPPDRPAGRRAECARLWRVLRTRHLDAEAADPMTRRHLLKDYAVARMRTGLGTYGEARLREGPVGRPGEAAALYRQAHGDFAWAHRIAGDEKAYPFNAGMALLAAGDGAAALPWFEEAVRMDPTFADAYGNAAQAASMAGDPQREGANLEAVLQLRPGLGGAKERLAELMRKGLYRPR
jgi:hypothetical protein